jgi:hypothetical protein
MGGSSARMVVGLLRRFLGDVQATGFSMTEREREGRI